MDNRDSEGSIKILMLPWLAYGHVTPYLDLAKNLSLHNIKVYFCSTPINLKPIRENPLHLRDFPLVELVDLHLQTSLLPTHYHTTRNLPFHLTSTLKGVFDKSKSSFSDLLKSLRPDLVIVDMFQPWAVESANDLNIKSVVFFTSSASPISFLVYYSILPALEYPLSYPESDVEATDYFLNDGIGGETNRDRIAKSLYKSSKLVLIRTSKELEPEAVDYLSALTNKEVVPVGTLMQDQALKVNKDGNNGYSHVDAWLNQRDPRSVVYVSFGSEYFLSEEEIGNVARGLERTKVNFIWVIRFPGGDDDHENKGNPGGDDDHENKGKGMTIGEALPEGFLKRVEKIGLILQGWAPQAMILEHPSTVGFVSHCGWSSTLEGITSGVPIIAMPMQADQFSNAMMIEQTGVGLEVPRRGGKIDGEEMAKTINEIVGSERGKQVRDRAMEYSKKLKGCEFDSEVVKKLVQLAATI